MKAISIINYKGGVGKTTLSVNIATELAFRGKKVLVIDLDPQANLTFSFMPVDEWASRYERERTLKYWFDSIIDESPTTPSFVDLVVTKHKVDIICSHLGLIDVDVELAQLLNVMSDRRRTRTFVKCYSLIKSELESIRNNYDIVLFDCPPNFGMVTKNALIASDYYVVPAKMDYLSTLGINTLRTHVNSLIRKYNEYAQETNDNAVNPEFLGVIATMIQIYSDRPTMAQQKYINELTRNDIPVFNSMLRDNKKLFSEGPDSALPVALRRTTQETTYAKVINEIEDIAAELLQKADII